MMKTMAMTFPSTKNLNEAQLDALKSAAISKLPEIIEHFGLNVTEGGKRCYGPCPIHGGDKYNGFSIETDGDKSGSWKCYTRQCHKIFFGDIIGLVRALLSRTKYQWSGPHDENKTASFKEAISFIVGITGCKGIKSIGPNEAAVERKKFINNMAAIYNKQKIVAKIQIPRDKVRSSLQIPSPYYMNRGYSEEILDKYDVGYCGDFTKPMYKRSVAPIYDEDYKYCIGCCGRSIFDRCSLCNTWHNPTHKCPETNKQKGIYSKWKNNYGFMGEYYLYNYWFSKPLIAKDHYAIIVESPGNIWRLEEAGVHHGVATFGAHFTDFQKDILDKSGALALIVLSDPDEAGRMMNRFIKESCEKTYQLHFPRIGTDDIGEMSIQLLQDKLCPIINEVKNGI